MSERVKLDKLRTLGDDERDQRPAAPAQAPADLQERAREVLHAEFQHALMMKEKLGAEAQVGGKEKGRDSQRQAERLRGVIASLEGQVKFALKMGLLTPSEGREFFARAMKDGLHEGWGKGA